MLGVQQPQGEERRRKISINRHNFAGRASRWTAVDGASGENRAACGVVEVGARNYKIANGNRASSRRDSYGPCRNRTYASSIVEGKKRLPVERFVSQTESTVNYSLGRSADVPCESEPGGEIRMIPIVGSADLLTDLNQAHTWVEAAKQVVLLLDHRIQLVAQA